MIMNQESSSFGFGRRSERLTCQNVRRVSVNLVTCSQKRLAGAKPKLELASARRRVFILLCKIVSNNKSIRTTIECLIPLLSFLHHEALSELRKSGGDKNVRLSSI